MTDLVKRLRGIYGIGPGSPPEFGERHFPATPIQMEAADEIERLAAELAEAQSKLDEWNTTERNYAGERRVRFFNLRTERDALAAQVEGLTAELASSQHCYRLLDEERERTVADRDRLAAELAEAKRVIERNKGSASYRLHNLCDALHEMADESPFTREAWDEQDKLITSVNHERRALQAQLDDETKLHLEHEAQHMALVTGLKDRIEALQQHLYGNHGTIDRLEAQVEGLREALERITTVSRSSFTEYRQDCERMIAIARAALAAGPEQRAVQPELAQAKNYSEVGGDVWWCSECGMKTAGKNSWCPNWACANYRATDPTTAEGTEK